MKKVLIITYYWPPAGGPGVQRWLKFVKYLPDFGIEPIVYVPENPTYPILDEKLVNDVPKQVTIIRKKIFEPYALASIFSKNSLKKMSSGIIPSVRKQTLTDKLALWIRGNVFIPDARLFWVNPSVKYLKKYISENQIDTIITSGPPHSLHLIGLKLKKRNPNLKWLADFRDPWTTIGYHKSLKLSGFADERHKSLEEKVLTVADKIIVTSKSTKREFEAITTQPIEVITNGFDVIKNNNPEMDVKFTLSHIGSLLSERNPFLLWQLLSELVKEVPGFSDHFELKLIGVVSQEILDTISQYNLKKFLNLVGYVSHSEAIVHQQHSQLLLLIEINSVDTKSIIPGKLFEYMVSGRPIIAIGPHGSDFAEIIEETKTGIFVDYGEKDKLKQTILEYYQLFLTGKIESNAIGIEKYSRKNLTAELAKLLK